MSVCPSCDWPIERGSARFLVLILGPVVVSPVVADQSLLVLRSHLELQETPLTVAQAGTYHVWVWAEKDKPIRLTLGGENLRAEAEHGTDFRWVKLGELELKGETGLNVTCDEQAARIGYVALGQGTVDPSRYFEASRVWPHRPGPIDDYRLRDSPVRAARDYPWKGKYTLRVKQSRRDEELRALLHSKDTRQGWMAHAKDLKEHMLFCLRLCPAPRKTPLTRGAQSAKSRQERRT